jgi:mono/diheme cytochrome c family protein
MALFEQACSRCHGPQGSFIDIPFKHKGAVLREITVEMMKGPGQLQPTEPEIEAMMACLRWIEAKRK